MCSFLRMIFYCAITPYLWTRATCNVAQAAIFTEKLLAEEIQFIFFWYLLHLCASSNTYNVVTESLFMPLWRIRNWLQWTYRDGYNTQNEMRYCVSVQNVVFKSIQIVIGCKSALLLFSFLLTSFSIQYWVAVHLGSLMHFLTSLDEFRREDEWLSLIESHLLVASSRS